MDDSYQKDSWSFLTHTERDSAIKSTKNPIHVFVPEALTQTGACTQCLEVHFIQRIVKFALIYSG